MTKGRLVLALITLMSIGGIVPDAFAADNHGRLSGQIEYNRVSPPASGVKLITQILDRVRSTPAFAMINKDKMLKKVEQPNYAQLGISNYQLAIKPKEMPRNSSVAALVPPPPPSSNHGARFSFAPANYYPPATLTTASLGGGGSAQMYRARQQMTIVNESAPVVMADSVQEMKAESVQDLRAKRKETIALLPPNVATGIPMIKLGITQAEAGQSLKAWGSMREEVLGNWTVWTFQRPNSDAPVLQVFMRHGFVEGLRIFDPGLVGHDLGVGLGDEVRVLKEQFGEPSFILSEPAPGAGQNYVYPLSQVAFLLSRPEPKSEPEVVSLLIFNVK
ncbi:MAG: hypothetical protein K2Y22_08860 [Candidatus Obscuribacterales bacterium]|nr:hypothetical protein [Candidatus Obscuribacterales bacterium]